jgi:hypothetical protein
MRCCLSALLSGVLPADAMGMTTRRDLVSIQHELDTMASARNLAAFNEHEGLQYQELCELERALLAGS